ncbi:MAG: CcdB family protein [Proteobacteria bacterium]|nr:CcdB family protein [Pseudomonadota bacterium]
MAQFDVHGNKGAQRVNVPFVVIVQSAQFDRYRRRVVVPLVRRSAMPAGAPTVGNRMNPVFEIDGIELVLHPLDMVSAAFDQLGERVGSLADKGQQITDALDELLTRSRG